MPFMMLLAAWFVGLSAASDLNHQHPTPAAWFEAGVTALLVVGAIVAYAIGGDD